MRQKASGIGFFLAMLLVVGNLSHGQETQGLGPGWLSLDSSVGKLDNAIQKGKSKLENYLFGFKLSGFLDTSYTWSSNYPDPDISIRVFDIDQNKIVFNHFNLTLDRAVADKGWDVGAKVVGDFGRTAELLREATLWGPTLVTEPSAELREANVTVRVPVGAGLQIKGGLFMTTLGTEIIPEPGSYNDNISRSYLFGFAIPFRHLGMLFTYPVHKTVSISMGPVTGWDNPHDNNKQPSFLAALNFTPADKFSLASSIIIGPEQKDNNGRIRIVWANVASYTPIDPLTLTGEFTYGHEQEATVSLRDADWLGVAAYANYSWTNRFSTALRGEFFYDKDGVRMGGGATGAAQRAKLGEFTLTGAYKFTEMLLGRVEVRQDWSDVSVFSKGSSGSDTNQTSIALQAIYTY